VTPLTEWLKPPRTLLLLLFLLTLVSISALGWFGFRLMGQERAVEAQRSQDRLEQAADRIAATVRSALAEAGDRVASGSPPQGVLLRLSNDSFSAEPPLLYGPPTAAAADPNRELFADAELLEFSQGQPEEALAAYTKLAKSARPSIRAGALLRIARVLRNTGQSQQAQAAYQELAALKRVAVEGEPADLIARFALAEMSSNPSEAESLRVDLMAGHWRLTRGQFQFYWSNASRIAGLDAAAPREAEAFSEAALAVWDQRNRDPEPRSQQTLWVAGQPFVLIWRGTPDHRTALIAKPESILAGIAPAGGSVQWAIVDASGRTLTGERSRTARAAVRTPAESQLPWTLYVSATAASGAAGWTGTQRFVLLGLAVMTLFLVLGTYFIARAIQREAETQRMQSAFVSAVSHEFRSPLTSMRQLSELLAFGRVPSEDRRQLYYDTLVRETSRLERLIESLLNFGRMEEGARRYRFEELDASVLVRKVVAEFEPQIAPLGRRIEMAGELSRCMIEADPDAIGVALRNLLDNALKYSPDQPAVWIEWGVRRERVAITVRDRGPGIAESEKKAIFRKFVRGSAALATNAKGSGVGLAMVRYIVEAHGGDITVASEIGQGSAFTMLLPVMENS
jgi:signal transduction histidine kinase